MPIRAVLFDFMGTCLDWHSSIVAALPSQMSPPEKSDFALQWRHAYFDANAARLASGEPPENIDITHRNVLDALLESRPEIAPLFTDESRARMVREWHHQKAWDDVQPAVRELKAKGYEVFVHANGTTRLQLDLVQSSGLSGSFAMLFSSELLGVYKPAARNYERVLELIGREAAECVTVAAHAYDLRGAKGVGMKTVYVYRWTDDVLEDQEVVKNENDAWLDGMEALGEVIERL
ncbi:(S)-2-haloacid dehalogenase IVA [Lecanosticta acicola]|uniref:(S)-2-haloacid dehalogenase IVA n=1 Tax=Lecanosticta acicola TaxID=111012 RepID=A0AAI8YY94_9PEZI|nr:(S)-2-haloacid dehalogenase IVA [Lecanosticta acicola]